MHRPEEALHVMRSACVRVPLQVPPQYPPEVRDVLVQRRNSMLKFDFSQPDYQEVKQRSKIYWTPLY